MFAAGHDGISQHRPLGNESLWRILFVLYGRWLYECTTQIAVLHGLAPLKLILCVKSNSLW